MADTSGISLELDPENLRRIARALRAEEDGKELRKELTKNMREALKPGAARAKSSIMSMASTTPHDGPALKTSIARKIRPEVRITGKFPGAKIKAFKTKNLRNFPNAPKRTNRSSGWRHPVYGNREVWVQQTGKVRWFDRAFDGEQAHYKRQVQLAVADMVNRIASRT
ncbi:hypothetical protein BIU87_20820 [Streptomyces sp. ZS0098]|uniref:hypothetical protein n=1 Tax=Streptomyces sp. ZS0098 TaxID=1904044 RepID=UPI000EFDAEEF|nr:hypothetical protein [Streptomyces sp. ZS0098]RMI92047.1 hypothetical protein BIU87_20820 [Streptomyces sp. ZS0098]